MRVITLNAQRGLEHSLPEQLPDLIKHHEGTVWVDMSGPGEKEVAVLRELFSFHPLAVEDTRNQTQRPKVEEYDDHLFLIINPITLTIDHKPVYHELDIFVGSNFVVTVHRGSEPMLMEVTRRLERANIPALTRHTPTFLLYLLLDTAMDGYFPLLERIQMEIDMLEDRILRNPTQYTLDRLFMLRRALSDMWRIVMPQRDIMNTLMHRNITCIDRSELEYYLRDVTDHLMWIVDMINHMRETVTTLLDFYMSSVSNRLNQFVNRLTILTLMIGAMTVISGFYGMNFTQTWPPFEAPWGVPFVLLLMTVVAGAIYLYVRRRAAGR